VATRTMVMTTCSKKAVERMAKSRRRFILGSRRHARRLFFVKS
jgi:hypothetical protein